MLNEYNITMMNWILALIGLALYFIGRYAKRRNKTKFNLSFWLRDNWPEGVTSILATVALMVIFLDEGAVFDFDSVFENVPFIKSLPTDKFISLVIGYLNSFIFYNLMKLKK